MDFCDIVFDYSMSDESSDYFITKNDRFGWF